VHLQLLLDARIPGYDPLSCPVARRISCCHFSLDCCFELFSVLINIFLRTLLGLVYSRGTIFPPPAGALPDKRLRSANGVTHEIRTSSVSSQCPPFAERLVTFCITATAETHLERDLRIVIPCRRKLPRPYSRPYSGRSPTPASCTLLRLLFYAKHMATAATNRLNQFRLC
jgi:hypothetical protein